MPASDLPSGVDVERISRRTLTIGFVGGQEKDVQYDDRVEKDNGEVHYRRFVETERETAPESGGLEAAAFKRTALKVMNQQDVSYTEFGGAEELFLVTWDHGKTVHIMEEEEMMNVIEAVLESEDRLRPSNIPSDTSDVLGSTTTESPPAAAKGEKEEEGEVPETIEIETPDEEESPPEPVQ